MKKVKTFTTFISVYSSQTVKPFRFDSYLLFSAVIKGKQEFVF